MIICVCVQFAWFDIQYFNSIINSFMLCEKKKNIKNYTSMVINLILACLLSQYLYVHNND